jgi:hypothetical protein
MDDDAFQFLGSIFLLILVLIFSSIGFLNMGNFYGNKEGTNKTTIECIEKPNICKDRYEYLKLGEKLQEN